MCFWTPTDNSAAAVAQQERERQAAVNAGIKNVDQQFSGFNDAYFNRVQQDALDYYTPQLNDQYQRTRRNLVLSLDKAGNLNSSAGVRQLQLLEDARNKNAQTIANQALGIANNQRAKIEDARSNLYNQVYNGADPGNAGATAASQVAALSATPAYGPLGDLFTNFSNYAANGIRAERYGLPGFNTGLFNTTSTSGKGSSNVVGA